MIGSQFLNVGASTKDINDFIIDGSDLLGLDDDGEYQTKLRVWTGTGYQTYGWLDADDGTNNEAPDWNNTWLLNDFSDIAIENMELGKGVWISVGQVGTITLAGEVNNNDTYTIDVVQGLNMIANPFPTTISIQNIKCDLAGLDDDGEYQTKLRVWTGTGYQTYGWLDADDGTNNEAPEWNNSWLLNDFSDLAKITLKVGQGFWFDSPTAGTVTFTK
ncbi:MAG: hypothetical protein IJ444_05940 [Kiritimatiellae bacterium]|nr:hypothetical protein [Kiritimatiellia bacterium]